MMVERFKRDLIKEFRNYDRMMLMQDLMAGLTVTAVAIPLALAFGVGSGATAASGLVTAIIAGVIISALGGAYFQISGPTCAMAAILMSIIAQYGLQGVFVATVLAGIILVIAGVLHLGKLISFIPMPVISGFTSGIAVIIAMGQIDNFFGVTSEGSSVTEKFLSYWQLGFEPNMTAVSIGLFVMLMMLLFPMRYSKYIPSSLFAIIVATAANIALNLDVAVVGNIPATLILDDRLELASLLDFRTVIGLLAPAVSIAVLAMIESLLCGATASRMTGARLDSNRELLAQGIGNIIVPFFGGIPATAAIARTSVAVKSGAVTRLTGIFHALGILLAMFVLAPVMSQIPLAALAGVLMVVSWRMNEWVTINFILKGKFKGAILKFVVTMLTTIIVDLTTAIMIGVITYISVLERKKEIGILRAIGASKRNVSQVFNAETFIIGLCAGLIGIGLTLLLLIPGNAIIHSVADNAKVNAVLPIVPAIILILLSVVLTLLGGLIPSKKAAKSDPVTALRTE